MKSHCVGSAAITSRSVARSLSEGLSTKITRRNAVRDRLWTFLEVMESSKQARWFGKFMTYTILISVVLTLTQTPQTPLLPAGVSGTLETVFEVIFTVEVLLRVLVCPSRWRYFQSPYNIMDIVAAAPLVVRASIGFVLAEPERDTPVGIFLLCVVPVLRLCKTLRRFQTFQLLLNVVGIASEALPVLMFVFIIIALVFSSLLFAVEPRSNLDSFPNAVWVTLVTMTTVGYGDVVPVTTAGRVVVSIFVIICLLYMSMPLGILGSEFTQTWSNRHRVLIIRRTRERLDQWGFEASDLPKLFQHYDLDEDGELNLADFRAMLQQMSIGLTEESIVRLFECFDCDGSGSIDEKEFVRAIFPAEFHEVYGSEGDGAGEPLPRQLSRCCDGQSWIDLTVPTAVRPEGLRSEARSERSLPVA